MRDDLLGWAATGWRDLPWRKTRDPWAVLVSELMLQQTQVSRVVPRWLAFMDRWPDPAACAAARQADVVRAWAGLGYNRRAVSLHRAAAMVVERHHGRLPEDLGALQQLPGVGAYTARAVLAFAFGHDVGVLDVNGRRVVARVAGSATDLQARADALVPPGKGWQWNQAILDLGAQVCTARHPKCGVCPIARSCAWRRDGGADPAPGSSRQSRFDGSDRQGRGRLLDVLRSRPVSEAELAGACGWPSDPGRAHRIAAGIVEDGFAAWAGDQLTLS